MTTALLLKVNVMEWPSMSSDLNLIEHMWGILKWKVEKHHVSNIQQLRNVIMEEWKRMPATTCAALVNSMPRRIKAVLDTFTFMHLADAFIQSDLHCIQVTVFYILSALAFPGNRTHDLGVASAMLYHLSYRKDNNGAPTKYWHFGHSFDMFT